MQPMAKTFTVGFGAKADHFELGSDQDVMDDNAESHHDPYGDEEEEEDLEGQDQDGGDGQDQEDA